MEVTKRPSTDGGVFSVATSVPGSAVNIVLYGAVVLSACKVAVATSSRRVNSMRIFPLNILYRRTICACAYTTVRNITEWRNYGVFGVRSKANTVCPRRC